MSAHPQARICIIGQAPGRKVQESGKPWADKSGENLMKWMKIRYLNDAATKMNKCLVWLTAYTVNIFLKYVFF